MDSGGLIRFSGFSGSLKSFQENFRRRFRWVSSRINDSVNSRGFSVDLWKFQKSFKRVEGLEKYQDQPMGF